MKERRFKITLIIEVKAEFSAGNEYWLEEVVRDVINRHPALVVAQMATEEICD